MTARSYTGDGAVAVFRRAVTLVALLPPCAAAVEPDVRSPEHRALSFLASEVPRWSRENHCFSCHNNGDAARALYAGLTARYAIEPSSLAHTTAWLSAPERWEHNGGDGPFSDKRLARIQFTTALLAASRAGQVKEPDALQKAAAQLAHDQGPDGSWPLEGENEPGSPVTYGRFLAAYLARQCLQAADHDRFRERIARADAWLLGHDVATLNDASIMLLVCAMTAEPRTSPRRARSLEALRKGQSDQGGWGPFLTSAPEVYDTALALIGLSTLEQTDATRAMIARGRAFLITQQQPDGSWIETTRPPGAESYAQRISTTGWATLALIWTRGNLTGSSPDLKR
jgi:hypothetical protein